MRQLTIYVLIILLATGCRVKNAQEERDAALQQAEQAAADLAALKDSIRRADSVPVIDYDNLMGEWVIVQYGQYLEGKFKASYPVATRIRYTFSPNTVTEKTGAMTNKYFYARNDNVLTLTYPDGRKYYTFTILGMEGENMYVKTRDTEKDAETGADKVLLFVKK